MGETLSIDDALECCRPSSHFLTNPKEKLLPVKGARMSFLTLLHILTGCHLIGFGIS